MKIGFAWISFFGLALIGVVGEDRLEVGNNIL